MPRTKVHDRDSWVAFTVYLDDFPGRKIGSIIGKKSRGARRLAFLGTLGDLLPRPSVSEKLPETKKGRFLSEASLFFEFATDCKPGSVFARAV